jgi:hypothetical protein
MGRTKLEQAKRVRRMTFGITSDAQLVLAKVEALKMSKFVSEAIISADQKPHANRSGVLL